MPRSRYARWISANCRRKRSSANCGNSVTVDLLDRTDGPPPEGAGTAVTPCLIPGGRAATHGVMTPAVNPVAGSHVDGLLPLAVARPHEALARARATLAARPPPLAASIARQAIGIVLRDRGETAEAIAELRAALRLGRGPGPPPRGSAPRRSRSCARRGGSPAPPAPPRVRPTCWPLSEPRWCSPVTPLRGGGCSTAPASWRGPHAWVRPWSGGASRFGSSATTPRHWPT